MSNEKAKQLHQTVVDAIIKVKLIIRNHQNADEEELTRGEKYAETIFRIASSWKTIFYFIGAIIIWAIYNISVPLNYRFDPFPFSFLTFFLAGFAAIQAPIIMISQHRQNQKTSNRLAENLKVDNEVLALHQSITVLMEQQMQQVLENQLTTIKLLQEIHLKSDQSTVLFIIAEKENEN